MKKRDHFVKRRKHPKSLRRGTGGINPCFRPSNEASKADLAEFHRENMGLRRAHQRDRAANRASHKPSKSDNPAYRKSIWPQSKIERKARGQ